MHVRVQVQILTNRQILVEAELLGHVGYPRLNRLWIHRRVDAEHIDDPAVGAHETGQQADQRSLARTVRSDHRRESATAQGEGDVVEREHGFAGFPAKGFSNPVQLQRRCRSGRHQGAAGVASPGACGSDSQPPPSALYR